MSTTVTLTEGDFRAIIAMVGPPTYLQRSQRKESFDQQETLSLQGERRHLPVILPSHKPVDIGWHFWDDSMLQDDGGSEHRWVCGPSNMKQHKAFPPAQP